MGRIKMFTQEFLHHPDEKEQTPVGAGRYCDFYLILLRLRGQNFPCYKFQDKKY